MAKSENSSNTALLDDSFYAEIDALKNTVSAALDEVMIAIQLHETWKPAAFDQGLHERMGISFATHTFQIIRWSLRREMLLALMRIWDKDQRAVRMTAISERLRDKEFFNSLVERRAADLGMRSKGVSARMRDALEPKRDQFVKLVRKYTEGGSGFNTISKLKALRHERLAHRQVAAAEISPSDATDQEIEFFYLDCLKLVENLLSLVNATAFDLAEAAGIYRHHAKHFWLGVQGERTMGHPNYRTPGELQA